MAVSVPGFASALLLSTAFAVVAVGCAAHTESADVDSARQALLEADRAWADAARQGDVARLTSYWSDDAVNYFPGAPPARGKAAIAELVERNRNQPAFSLSWEPEAAVVAQSEDLGYTTGSFELTISDPKGNPATRRGHYVCIWRKQPDGSWKCTVESSIFGPPPRQ